MPIFVTNTLFPILAVTAAGVGAILFLTNAQRHQAGMDYAKRYTRIIIAVELFLVSLVYAIVLIGLVDLTFTANVLRPVLVALLATIAGYAYIER